VNLHGIRAICTVPRLNLTPRNTFSITKPAIATKTAIDLYLHVLGVEVCSKHVVDVQVEWRALVAG
jgi:hypothetical protein